MTSGSWDLKWERGGMCQKQVFEELDGCFHLLLIQGEEESSESSV